MGRMRTLWQSCLDVIFPPPPTCFFCQRQLSEQGRVCLACLQQIAHPSGPLCRRCGRPLPADQSECRQCRGKDWSFRQARSIGPYSGNLRSAVHRLKFHRQTDAAPVLAGLIFQAVEADWWPRVSGLVPVPLHPQRLRQRGYNQAQLLAYELSLLCRRPLQAVLARRQDTPPQQGLNQEQRRRNMQDAFQVVPGRETEIQDQCLVLVDDVLTTGSTLDACARALLDSGCRCVLVLTVAITNLE